MSQEKTMPAATNRDAMSRALGAAFLSHQVEQLEKTVSTKPRNFGPSSTRPDRNMNNATGDYPRHGDGRARKGPKRFSAPIQSNKQDAAGNAVSDDKGRYKSDLAEGSVIPGKDADLIIVDASVLVHSLGQVKSWCRNGREEVIVVPLEALNTLDLLKKGTSVVAQHARSASRFLEQQVGSNPRIKVQRDDAFVLWDDIPFTNNEVASEDASMPEVSMATTPEWLRRTICCAKWEFENSAKSTPSPGDEKESHTGATRNESPLSVVLAVTVPNSADTETTSQNTHAVSSSPVPLPMSQHINKHEQRSDGKLVREWGKKAGLTIQLVNPVPRPSNPNQSGQSGGCRPRSYSQRQGHGRASSDEEWRGGSSPSGSGFAGGGKAATVGRKIGSKNTKSPHFSDLGRGSRSGAEKERLVERPAATMAMNASMMQSNNKVRLLARGEKLDP